MKKSTRFAIFSISASLLLIGCSKNTTTANENSTASQGASAPNNAIGSSTQGESDKEQFTREALQDLGQYKSVIVGEWQRTQPTGVGDPKIAVREMYWSKADRNDQALASDYLQQYRQEKDSFKRADIIKANASNLDMFYNQARGSKLFGLETDVSSDVQIGRYDAQQKGFEVRLSFPEGEYYHLLKPNEGKESPIPEWDILPIGSTTDLKENGKKIYYHPKNENEAREIEEKLAKASESSSGYVSAGATRLGHILKSLPSTAMSQAPTIIFVTDAVIVRSPATRDPIFVIDREQLGNTFTVSENKLRQTLGLPPNYGNRAKFM
jgi:hypothetical protein